MTIQILAAILIGMACGIFTGIIPGIHVNLVAAGVIATLPLLLAKFDPIALCAFIMSLAVTHSFLDTIPSTFLGAPDEDKALSALPAQRMLINGEGYSAIKITLLGAYAGLILAAILAPIFIIFAKPILEFLRPYLKYLLLVIAAFLIARETNLLWCLFLFMLSGSLGIATLSMDGVNQPLFCLLSGLFGTSGLLLSFFENTKIPEQKFEDKIDLKPSNLVKVLAAATIGVITIQFFPGTGPNQGAVLSTSIIREIKEKAYLALIGAMGTMSAVFSLTTFFSLAKARDGSIVAMSKILEINFSGFLLLMISFLVAGSFSVAITLWMSRKFSAIISKVNYRLLAASIILFIILLSIYFDGLIGILILVTSTAVGLIAPLKNIPRSHAMGCLLFPVMIYLFI